MRLRAKLVVVFVVFAVAVAGCAWVLVASPGAPGGPTSDATTTAVHAFFDRYVDPDGRVVRRDQGDDTVSEGQSYALLLAAITGDRDHFDRVWTWTTGHLQRSDGLFSWRYADGSVADPMSATDADVQTAWALSIAARQFGGNPYRSAGRQLATSILDHESVTAAGTRYLAAGPWATGDPAVLNPGYAAPEALTALGQLTGDPRWTDIATATRTLGTNLGRQQALPPDWITIGLADGRTEPIAAPDHSAPTPLYSLDAARLVAWFGADCDTTSTAAAARWSSGLADHPFALARQLSGDPVGGDESAASEAAAASAARATGDNRHAGGLLDDARQFDQAHPTYYGSAWVALGQALLDPHAPLGCPTSQEKT